MSVFLLIVCIYVALNLAMLVFRPVRKAWHDFFTEAWPEFLRLIKDLWCNLEYDVKGDRWLLPLFYVLICPVISLLLFLFLLVLTVVPYIQYSRAIEDVKRARYEKSEEYQQYKHREQQYELWCDNAKNTIIRFDQDLPFKPEAWDVFYVEDEYNPAVNEYITEHYNEICFLFAAHRWVFNYLPKISNHPVPLESIRYMFPYYKQDSVQMSDNVGMEDLMRHVVGKKIPGPALIRLKPSKVTPFYEFYCLSLETDSDFTLSDQINWYLRQCGVYCEDDGMRYMIAAPEDDEVADSCFNDGDADSSSVYSRYSYMNMKPEDSKLVKEILDRVNELRKRGFQLGLLHKLIEERPTMSRLVVDKDFRILLPDYNNIEIVMQPLPKAVYLLFLKHPEGIMFKHLSDYHQELLDIYMQVGNREIEKNIKRSIRDITDPTKNSVNEKCTRIREAFLARFDYAYARHYFITGKRGEPKKIDLPQHLIELQCF